MSTPDDLPILGKRLNPWPHTIPANIMVVTARVPFPEAVVDAFKVSTGIWHADGDTVEFWFTRPQDALRMLAVVRAHEDKQHDRE